MSCPCSIYGLSEKPTQTTDSDPNAVSLGVKFQSDISGYVTGVRYYRPADTSGTHTGSLWTIDGQRLATVTFTGETASGWQQANFATPVQITAGTSYVGVLLRPERALRRRLGYLQGERQPVRARAAPCSSPSSGGNGVYGYGGDVFPANSYGDANYWVTPILSTNTGPTGPTVLSRTPAAGATGVATSTTVTATFDQSVQPASAVVTVTGPGNVAVAGTTVYTDANKTVTFTPSAALRATPRTSCRSPPRASVGRP